MERLNKKKKRKRRMEEILTLASLVLVYETEIYLSIFVLFFVFL